MQVMQTHINKTTEPIGIAPPILAEPGSPPAKQPIYLQLDCVRAFRYPLPVDIVRRLSRFTFEPVYCVWTPIKY
jgi:hypothetical protein